MQKLFVLLLSALFVISCNNAADTNATTTDSAGSKDSNSASNSTAAESQAEADMSARAEINSFPGYDTAFMKIVYFNAQQFEVNDTIFGLRKPGNDTLHVEGDIMELYPEEGARGVATTSRLWPVENKKIIVTYTINTNYTDTGLVMQAIREWEKGLAVSFVKKKIGDGRLDYIEFVSSGATQSFVGCIKRGMQPIELADWARKFNIAHEIGHSLGLYHEMTRKDRDSAVKILCATDINYRHAYKGDPSARDLGPYNLFSIMHYPETPCMEVIKKAWLHLPAGVPGQRSYIHRQDYTALRTIYGL